MKVMGSIQNTFFSLWLSLLGAAFFPGPGVAQLFEDGIVGADDRAIIQDLTAPWDNIGRVNVAGKRFCTGTLVAADLVLTAAHCLVRHHDSKPYRLDQIHFVAGQWRDQHRGHSTAAALEIRPEFRFQRPPQLEQAWAEVAYIRLKTPLDLQGVATATLGPEDVTQARFLLPSYARDRPYMLSLQRDCRVLHVFKTYWLTDCDSLEGASGAPLLVEDQKGLHVVAILVGYGRNPSRKFSVAIPITEASRLQD